MNQQLPSGHLTKKLKTLIQKDIYSPIFIVGLFTFSNIRKQ